MSETLNPEARAHLFDLQRVVSELADVRKRWRTAQKRSREPGGRELPSREALGDILDGLRGALFPMRLGPPDLRQESEDFFIGHTLDTSLNALLGQVRLELRLPAPSTKGAVPRPPSNSRRASGFATSRTRCLRSANCSTATWWRPSRATPAARSVGRGAAVLPRHPGHDPPPRGTPLLRNWAYLCWRASWPNSHTAPRASTSTLAPPLVRASSSTTERAW